MTTMRMHTRWHTKRGRVDDRCSICQGEAPETTWSQDVDAWIRADRRQQPTYPTERKNAARWVPHAEVVNERRAPDERAALLDEVLADLRAGTRRRVPTYGPLPF